MGKEPITKEWLTSHGFERAYDADDIAEHMSQFPGCDDYVDIATHRIRFTYGLSNRLGADWSVHIDNQVYETIASADIGTVEEFFALLNLLDIRNDFDFEYKKAPFEMDEKFNYKCPDCGHILKYDVWASKYRCAHCGGIYTFGLEAGKFVVRKWKEMEI